MGMNETPSANRVHIGIFGKRNAGKSSMINAVTGQNLAIVSEIKGTTTDPVKKAMELLPLGPVLMIDTPGLDDGGPLGRMRVEKAYQALNQTDIAVLVVDGEDFSGKKEFDAIMHPLTARFAEKKIPYIIAVNKSESLTEEKKAQIREAFWKTRHCCLSAQRQGGIFRN